MARPEWMFWSGKRWALFMPPGKQGVLEVKVFRSAFERDTWVAKNPAMREAVGKRHPAVKAFRQRMES